MSKLRAQQGLCLDLTFKVESVPGGGREVLAAQLREDAVFKWARSSSRGEMTRWSEPWLKAPPLSVRFLSPPLAWGKHVCWNSQQSSTDAPRLYPAFSRVTTPCGPPGPAAATTASCPWEGQRRRPISVRLCCLFVCVFTESCEHLSGNLAMLGCCFKRPSFRWFIHRDPTLTKASPLCQCSRNIRATFLYSDVYLIYTAAVQYATASGQTEPHVCILYYIKSIIYKMHNTSHIHLILFIS